MKTKKLLSVVFLLLLVANFASVAPNINATQIPEGAVIKTKDNPDVYIVKYKNGKQFKRLVLNPQVFESYGHLRWEDILIVDQSEMDSFVVSDLVRVDGQTDIYQLVSNGDIGSKHLLISTSSYDLDSIYIINPVDFGNYVIGEVKGVYNNENNSVVQQQEEISRPGEEKTEIPDELNSSTEDIKDVAYLEVNADNAIIASDGYSVVKIYATVKDADFNPIANKTVKFSISGNLTTESKTSNAGIATSGYISSGIVGVKTILVTVDNLIETIQIEEIDYPEILEFDVNPSDNGVAFGLKVDKDYIFKITLDNGMYIERNIKDKYISANTRVGTGIGYSSDDSKNPAPDTEYSYTLEVKDRDGNITTRIGTFRTLK